MDIFNDIKEFIISLQNISLIQKDGNHFMCYLDSQYKLNYLKKEIRIDSNIGIEGMRDFINKLPEYFEIIEDDHHIHSFDDHYFTVMSELNIKYKRHHGIIKFAKLQMDHIVKKEDNRLVVLGTHIIQVDTMNYYSLNNKDLFDYYKMKEFKSVLNNIPGGVLQCMNDEPVTIQSFSNGFKDLFGYTMKDIRKTFDGSFQSMIDERDRKRVRDEVLNQLKIGNDKTVEYRVTHKDGRTIWVLDKGQLLIHKGIESFVCILVDITKEKKAMEQLNLNIDRYQILINQTKDIIFDWDIHQQRITFFDNWEKTFNTHVTEITLNDRYTEFEGKIFDFIYITDKNVVVNMITNIMLGSIYEECEVRLLLANNEFSWFKIRITSQFDENDQPIRAVGVMVDIDNEKSQSEMLLQKSQVDTLTGLLNKMTAQSKVDERLSKQENGVLLFLDLDNFKQINDFYGHLFGDTVLVKISQRIQRIFRKDDIIGRIGGDEFLIFLSGELSKELIIKKSNEILKEIKELNREMNHEFHLSASIGVATSPEDGHSLQELYQRADHALYKAKSKGKDCCMFYSDAFKIQENIRPVITPSTIDERIDSNKEDQRISLVDYIVKILYQSHDINMAVTSILEIIGKQFNVSRVYIFENDYSNLYCSCNYEWCNENIISMKDKWQDVSYINELPNYLSNFDSAGLFYCVDEERILTPRLEKEKKSKAILQSGIYEQGVFRGFIGVDDCIQCRYWDQEQVNLISLLAEILSIFLLKTRAKEIVEKELKNLLHILDKQNAGVYVVDKHSYELLYLNHKARSISNKAKVGVTCFNAFFDRFEQCDICPLKQIENGRLTKEIYNNILDAYIVTNVDEIIWQGRDAVVITCLDITSYKN